MTDLQAKKYFFIFTAIHLLVWTLVPTLVSPHAPLDVIEGYAWGQEWLLGTHKHPPMQSWLLHIASTITSHANITHFLLSQIAIAITFWAVWDIARKMTSEITALAVVLLLATIKYYNFVSTEFNPNILQIMFWALIAHSFYFAVRTGKMPYWILLGIWAACGMYSKYFTGLFLLVLTAFTLHQPDARRHMKTIGPYLSFAIFMLLFTPHILWLIQHDFIPFAYTQDRLTDNDNSSLSRILYSLDFSMSQLAMLTPMIVFTILLCGLRRERSPLQDFDRTFLTYATFGTWALTCILSILFDLRLRNMWGASFWSFAPLYLVTIIFGRQAIRWRKRFIISWFCFVILLPILYALSVYTQPYTSGKIKRVHFAGQELSRIVEQEWQARYHTSLPYVIGDTWVAGSVAHYATSRPSLFLENNPVISHWTNPDDVHEKGGVYLVLPCLRHCTQETYTREKQEFSDMLKRNYPQADIQSDLFLRPATASNKPQDIVIYWAIIPPATGQKQ